MEIVGVKKGDFKIGLLKDNIVLWALGQDPQSGKTLLIQTVIKKSTFQKLQEEYQNHSTLYRASGVIVGTLLFLLLNQKLK